MLEDVLHVEGPLDWVGTLGPLGAGAADPTLRVGAREALRATRTPEGPATLHLVLQAPGRVRARAWGEGAAWALARAAAWLGDAPPSPPPDLPPPLREMARRAQGVRLARTHRVVETLVPLVLGQLVTGKESSRAFRLLVRTFSEPAPGPFLELRLPLGARELGAMPAAALPAAGASARHAVTLREVAFRARRLEEADALPHAEAERRLRAIPGIGPWTAGCALLYGMGHADAVPLGDYHLPHQVAWNLAGEPRGDDARMLELLEPYRGFRGRVVRWIERAGRRPPRRGPRFPLRPLDPEALGWLRAGR